MEIQKSLQVNTKNPSLIINNDYRVGDTELIVNNSFLRKNEQHHLHDNNGSIKVLTSPRRSYVPENSTTMGSQHSAYIRTSQDDDENPGKYIGGSSSVRRDGGGAVARTAVTAQGAKEENQDVFTRYYRHKIWFVILIRSCCIASVISVCMNTPKTFKRHPWLNYTTLIIDIVTGFILTCEAVIKIRSKGFFRTKRAYIRSTGRILEFVNVVCINISIILQILEITIKLDEKVSEYIIISLIRVPRPLLLLRVLKSILNLSLPKTVSPRSLKQIWGVLLFTLYFMTLAALIGVQTFGLMKYYCVKPNTTVTMPNYDDFLIPATRCSKDKLHKNSFQCPTGFACKELRFDRFRQQRQYFSYILPGLLTVYEATSMEGWSLVMYDTMDTRHFVFGIMYFICLIFFIALLVRNVFIAIVTEAFADLRVQVSKYSTRGGGTAKEEQYHVLRKLESDNTMALVKEDHIATSTSRAAIYKFVHLKGFVYFIYLCVLVDAVFQSLFTDIKYIGYVQIVFTMLFNAEALLKIYGMGLRPYWGSHPCRFEAVLCVGSTAFLAPVFMKINGFAVFQVLRPFRLILLWGALTTFLKRILGSGKKMTSLVVFTVSSLVIASGITLQLFCGFGLKEADFEFDMFPQAMRAIFQVFMAEAWNEVMEKVLYVGGLKVAWLVFIVFVLFHMLAALILVSVFVALILDNLELSEELKIAKQRRLGEEVVGTQKELPRRVRIYDHLKPRPKVVNMEAVDGNLPRVRQSFVSRFISSADDRESEVPLIANISSVSLKLTEPTTGEKSDSLHLSFVEHQPKEYHFWSNFRKQSSVTALMQESHLKRMSIFSHGKETVHRKGTVKPLQRAKSQSSSLGSKHSRISSNGNPGLHPTLAMRLTSASSVLSQQDKKNRNRNQKRDGAMKDIDVGLVRQKLEEAQRRKELLIEDLRENHPKFDESLFVFSANNSFRKFIHKLVHARYDKFTRDELGSESGAFSIDRFKRYLGTQTYLDWLMLLLTQISCLSMLVETPSHRTFDNSWLTIIEYTFVISTSIELTLKIIADGLIFAPNAFIRDFGSVLHVLIYIVSLIYVCWHPSVITPGSGAQILLVLRALRPLRIITLAPQLRKVVWVLVSGYKDMMKVAILQGVLMFVFASYGVQTLGGRLKACNDETITTEEKCTGVFNITLAAPRALQGLYGKQPTMLVPRVWRNPRNFDFDDMGSAFLALFEVISLEGWTEVRDIINQKVNWIASLYPHFYVFFAALIGLTLFIGVIVSSFNENKGIALLTVEQKRWKDLKKKLELAQPLLLPPRPLSGGLRGKLYQIFVGTTYNRFYAVVVLINCSTLCIGQWSPTDRDVTTYNWFLAAIFISIICCVYFTVETVLKIYAFTFKGYMLSWRNRADFIFMLGGDVFSVWTILSCYVGATKNSSCNESMLLGVAVFVFRFLSLSGKHNGLRMLMLTVLMSLSKSFYTISVLLMIMACYAFTGVILFGKVKHGISLNKYANFENSGKSLLLLFRITTGEDWNKVMHDAMLSPPYCHMEDDQDYRHSNCGNKWGALVFFHSYYLIISYIFLNLFIAVVIENFSIFYSTDDDPIMSQQDIAHFQEIWNFVDTDKSGSVSPRRARFILRLLRGGLDLENQKNAYMLHYKRICAEIDKKRNGKPVTFHNLLFILAYKKIDVSKSLLLEERLEREELDYTILEEVAKETIRVWLMKVIKRRREMTSVKRKRLERRDSIHSGLSVPSMDSQHSEFDDMNTSLHSGVIYPPTSALGPAGVNHEANGLENFTGLRRRKADDRKEYKSEIYSWWDDEMEDEQS